MEPTQKAKIANSLHKLIDLTVCSPKFLAIFRAKSIFSKSDVQLVETEERNRGQLSASTKFYDLLISRKGSFHVLLKALEKTKQNGALAFLSSSSQNDNTYKNKVPRRFIFKPPKYIVDYVSSQDENYLIVCSNNCQLTCDWILETTSNCTFYGIEEVLEIVSEPLKSSDKCIVLLTNLEESLDPIYSIDIKTQLKIVFVTGQQETGLNEKLPHPTSAWKVVPDVIQWTDLSSTAKFEISSGLKQNLNLDLKMLTNALLNINTRSLVDLLNGKFPVPKNLFRETIPPLMSYYVTRTLQTRHVIAKEILSEDLYNDIVLFSGIERFLLSNMCRNKLIESSSNLLKSGSSVSQFAFLENKHDFERISEKFSDFSVHHLDYKDGDFIWKKSKGNMSIIRKNVAAKQRTLAESEFISGILAQKNLCPVCISDTPGMGKSTLLANLAIEVKKHHEEGIVAFIIIKELIQHFKEAQPISPSTILCGVSKFLSTSSLGPVYLQCNQHYLRELMLDGFDEIDADDMEFAFQCVREICSVFWETRIWFTTRPHMLPELERCLKTLGYNITPFTKTNQIHFLSSFWSSRIENYDNEDVTQFADQCLKTLEASLGSMKEDIAGIPLQCMLIGEVYEDDAKRFLTNTLQPTPSSSQITTIADLYEKLVDKRMKNFESRYNSKKINDSDIFKAHMRMGLEILYPSHVLKFSDMLVHSMSRQDIFDVGLVEGKSVLSPVEFLHRTFAEYFVALFVSESLEKHPSDVLFSFLFSEIMATGTTQVIVKNSNYRTHQKAICLDGSKFQQNVTCYFLNNFIRKSHFNFKACASFLNHEHACSIAQACIYHNLENIFVKIIIDSNLQKDVINEVLLVRAVYWADVHFLNLITAECLSLDDIKPIIAIDCHQFDNGESSLHNYLGYRSDNLDSRHKIYNETSFTLLHVAMEKADYATVDFLVTNHFWVSVQDNIDGMYNNLLSILLRNSQSNTDCAIAEKKLIVSYLSILKEDLLILENREARFPLETEKAHLDLVFEVWKLARKFYSKINTLVRVIRHFSLEMTCVEFYKLIKTIFSDTEEQTINEVIRKSEPLQNICDMEDLNLELLNFLKSHCSSFVEVNSYERISSFKHAFYCVKENVLEWLLNNLAYTREDIRVLVAHCLKDFYFNGLNALLVYIMKQKNSVKLPSFCEMFEFLFIDKTLTLLDSITTIVNLVNYFVMKNHFKDMEKIDFESTLMLLIQIGVSYFDQLITKCLVTSCDGCVLKLVWITFVCSNLKNEVFASKLVFYLKDYDIQLGDTSGNTLLHFFTPNSYCGINSVKVISSLLAIKFSKGFVNMLRNDYRHFDLIYFWEVLTKIGLSVLRFNIHKQTPVCLLLQPKGFRENFNITSKIIMSAVSHVTAKNEKDIEKIHQIFYLVIKSHNISVVKNLYDWYGNCCKFRNIEVKKVKVNFFGEVGNFLDAAIKSGDGDVVEFVRDVLQINKPLLYTRPTNVHLSIPYWKEESLKYIQYLRELFPGEINQLVDQPNEKNLVPLSLPELTLDIVKTLHDFGANINATDDKGNTPLHFALKYDDFFDKRDVVESLISCGSDVNAQNNQMEAPLCIVARNHFVDTFLFRDDLDTSVYYFEMLIKNKADPFIKDNAGNTAIHHLVRNIFSGNLFHRIVQILISNNFGNVLTMRNSECQTPLQIADKYFAINENTLKLLRQHNIIYL